MALVTLESMSDLFFGTPTGELLVDMAALNLNKQLRELLEQRYLITKVPTVASGSLFVTSRGHIGLCPKGI